MSVGLGDFAQFLSESERAFWIGTGFELANAVDDLRDLTIKIMGERETHLYPA